MWSLKSSFLWLNTICAVRFCPVMREICMDLERSWKVPYKLNAWLLSSIRKWNWLIQPASEFWQGRTNVSQCDCCCDPHRQTKSVSFTWLKITDLPQRVLQLAEDIKPFDPVPQISTIQDLWEVFMEGGRTECKTSAQESRFASWVPSVDKV